MTEPAEALATLRQLAASVAESRPEADAEALADRLLERVSCRADALVLRAALVEVGARSLFDGVPASPLAAAHPVVACRP